MVWNKEDTIWLAGLLDGEGYFGIIRKEVIGTDERGNSITKNQSYYPIISVQMTHEATVQRVADITGIGVVNSYQPTMPNSKKKYCWHVHRFSSVNVVLPKVLPYLFTKHEQAMIISRYIDDYFVFKNTRQQHTRSQEEINFHEENYAKVKMMNQRGVRRA